MGGIFRVVSKMCSLYANVAEGLVRKVLECELFGWSGDFCTKDDLTEQISGLKRKTRGFGLRREWQKTVGGEEGKCEVFVEEGGKTRTEIIFLSQISTDCPLGLVSTDYHGPDSV